MQVSSFIPRFIPAVWVRLAASLAAGFAVALAPTQEAGAASHGTPRREADATPPGLPPPTDSLPVRLSWGHRSRPATAFRIELTADHAHLAPATPEGFEADDFLKDGVGVTRAGGGDVDALTAKVSWTTPSQAPRTPQSIWQFLLDHGEAGQVRRLKDDPGLVPNGPVLRVLTAADGTRGFSIGLEQLARHGALWLPEHDVFVTRADAPVDFAAHLASLHGQRVLDAVRHEPEASRAEWTNRWADFGDPTRPHHGQETDWLGTRGHLTGAIARHGSLYKFGVDRWGNVRPDHASPHKFRLDLEWPEARWEGQRIVDGLPIIVTRLAREGQQVEFEQFAAPLDPCETPDALAGSDPRAGDEGAAKAAPHARGEVASVFFTRVQLRGGGPFRFGIRLPTESTNRHPELRELAGRTCLVDRESGAVWLRIEPEAGLKVEIRPPLADTGNPSLGLDCVGELAAGETRAVILKLASPVATPENLARLAALEFATSRAEVVRYWEEWLARGAQFTVPEAAVNDLFRANLWHALLLPRHRTDERGVARIDLPYSNFAYGQYNADWPINQAVYVDYMIYGLRGYFDVAETEFAAMYQTQQKPDGRVGGYADWGVYSPSMLYSIGQNFLLSADRAAFERLLPASLKALDWCLREVARGQDAPETPGLIVAPLNDLTHDARAWGFPNAYFVAGLEVFGRALERYGHSRAGTVIATARQMRADVERAFARASVRAPAVQLADGTWNNYVPGDAMTPRRLLDVWYPTDVDSGPLHLARLNAIDPRGWLTSAMLDDHEDNLFLNQWGMANEPVYNQQATAYLYRDEPEAVIRAFYSMMACAFSHHQLTPLEHRWAWGQYYMPPSTDGAWFELYRNLLVNELAGDGTLFIGQAVPRAWMADGQRISVTGAPTSFGPVTLQFESAAASGRLAATVQFQSDRRPRALCVRLRHPEKKPLRRVTVNGAEWEDFDPEREWVRLTEPREAAYSVVARY